jgi:hypothetical protein
VADTSCMPRLVVALFALLPTDIKGATSRLAVVGWRRRGAPLLHGAIRRGACQVYGHQTGAAEAQVGPAEA